ncbi:MAG: 8-amino-7-oxononanoate synthase [Arenicella sp.]|jgi:8-amino-7-oxononanoate synthase
MLACLAQKGDTYITDELIHASLIDGIRLSYANRFRFRHNDLADLESKLQKATGTVFVVVESVYSMDGDCGKLVEISQLCEQYQAHLIVDEAHGIGIFGEKGEGLSQQLGLAEKCFARIYTFGKASGCHGAVVVGSENLRTYLINFCRSFIYTTALPLHSLASIRVSYQLMESAKSNREKLHELIAYFQIELAKSNKIQTITSQSAIQGIVVSGNENVSKVAHQLQQKNIWAKAIRSPTVPEGLERLRICLHSYNTKEEIDLLKNHLENILGLE